MKTVLTCPVCKGLPLDSTWAENTRAEAKRLNDLAADAEQADAALTRLRQTLKDLVPAAPAVLAEDLGDEADPRAAATAWQRWTDERTADNFRVLEGEVTALRNQAADASRRREAAWLPVATALGEWITAAKAGRDAAAKLTDVRNAIAWLKKTGTELRNERLAPFTEASARVWQLLRQESNVELGPVTLTGTGTKRKVSLDVTVDGEDGAALSVMSQGELHALGLALFLPRATAAARPFGFMVIDDPVQSMDPAKVDGLARVLDEVARARQVVVFTHDDRLAAAIRQLQIPATVWSVTRRERSVVQLARSDDPVRQYIDDALALALTPRLDESVKSVAVAGMCRFAIEAACVEAVRARLLRSGTRHAEVEKTLEEAPKLAEKLSLVLFRDKDHRGRDIREKLQQWDRSFADVFDAVNAGAHGAYRGDLKYLARHTQKLVKEQRR